MLPKNAFLILSAAFFICFALPIGKASGQQASFYFSAGYNKAWYSPSTIHVEQTELNNSYDIRRVKGDNKTQTAISATQLNYRLGYYCNYEQTLGIELNFDPVDYRVIDGQNVTIHGTINGIPRVTRTVNFSAKSGYYYKFDGANIMLLNIVRRTTLYRTNNKRLGVDWLIKGGLGPVMPHVENSLPVDPVDDPKLQWGGWSAAVETGLRISIYRYGYIELAGKYDYAALTSLDVYDGTASQNLSSYEAIASVGLTLPATRNNPLFYRQKIITVIPLFIDAQDSMDKENTEDSLLNIDTQPLADIPEFPELADRAARFRYHDSMAAVIHDYDSLAAQAKLDSTASQLKDDSIRGQERADSLLHPQEPASNGSGAINKAPAVNLDSLENEMLQGNNATPAPVAAPLAMSEKDKKRQAKKEEKEKKKLEKQQEKEKKKKEKEDKAAKEAAEKEKKDTPVPSVSDSTGKGH